MFGEAYGEVACGAEDGAVDGESAVTRWREDRDVGGAGEELF